jgi:hypothetical protein
MIVCQPPSEITAIRRLFETDKETNKVQRNMMLMRVMDNHQTFNTKCTAIDPQLWLIQTYVSGGFDVTNTALLSPTLATYTLRLDPSSERFNSTETAVAPDATMSSRRDCMSVIKNALYWYWMVYVHKGGRKGLDINTIWPERAAYHQQSAVGTLIVDPISMLHLAS